MQKQQQSSASLAQFPPAPVMGISLVFLLISVVLWVALISYNPEDPAWRHNNGVAVTNSLGGIGAWYSDLSFSLIGKLGYLLPLAFFMFAVHLWREKSFNKELFSWRLFMLLTAILSGCVLWAKHDLHIINTVAQTGGGAVGAWLAIGLQKSIKSIPILMAFSGIIFAISMSLLLNFPWGSVTEWIGRGILALIGNLFGGLGGSRSNESPKKTDDNNQKHSPLQDKIQHLNETAELRKQSEKGVEQKVPEDAPKPKFTIDRYEPETSEEVETSALSHTQDVPVHKAMPEQVQTPEGYAQSIDEEVLKPIKLSRVQESSAALDEIPMNLNVQKTPQFDAEVPEKSEPNFFDFDRIAPEKPESSQPRSAPEIAYSSVKQTLASGIDAPQASLAANFATEPTKDAVPASLVPNMLFEHRNPNAVEEPVEMSLHAQSRPATNDYVAMDIPAAKPKRVELVQSQPAELEPIEPAVVEKAEAVAASEPVIAVADVQVAAPVTPIAPEPVVSEPVVSEPVVSEPVVSEPVVSEPVVSEPVVSEPVVSEPVVSEPVVSEPVVPQVPVSSMAHTPRIEPSFDGIVDETLIQPESAPVEMLTVTTDVPAAAPTTTATIGKVYDNVAEVAEMRQESIGESYALPTIDLLDVPPAQENAYTEDVLADMAGVLEKTLTQFNIKATVMHVSPGPVITRFELELAPGIQAKKITNLSQDLARALAVSRVRVEEVIPGSSYVGLEVPNKQRQTVYFHDIVCSKTFRDSQSPLTISLGSDTSGKPQVVDLMKMPHALVAGTTGSGKSVCINVMLLSMLYKASPKDLRLILVDPKMLEMSMYEDIPHLLTPVITDMTEAENALTWAVGEMERRYQLMAALKVRKIDAFNEHVEAAIASGDPIKDPLWEPDEQVGYTHHPTLERLPFIVIVIDELADMMMVVGKQVEQLIARLTQKARAAGIHVVLATQRPSTDVLTGLIKANVPTRIAFQVSSGTDSRVIIDGVGAEKLLGHGDMLYVPPGASHPQRLHGAFVGDAETDRITDYLRSTGEPQYIDGITGKQNPESLGAFGAAEAAESKEDADPLYEEAVQIVLGTGKASISSVQRHLRIGYNRAARMIEDMQEQGIVSAPVNGVRKVLGK